MGKCQLITNDVSNTSTYPASISRRLWGSTVALEVEASLISVVLAEGLEVGAEDKERELMPLRLPPFPRSQFLIGMRGDVNKQGA
jgi:hypothetical protein